ncbi:MAG TPA: YdcF family protein [Pyrinomonadaceae bacterium]|jgi:uncharacterized SAM-binding protein YcdF (DUF218 family)|nr:YdcF family protein [Pyrinomonadaceae bacterium]
MSKRWKVVLILVLAWPFVAWFAALVLIKPASLPRADAVVVLSGSSAYIERSRRAAELYKEGRVPKILLTNDNLRGGWSEAQQRNPLFVERAQEELARSGVPSDRVEVLPDPVAGTHDEAVAVYNYATQKGMHSVLFVTSPYHTRRTLWTVQRVFRDTGVAVGVETMENGEQTPAAMTWWLYPRAWRVVALEYPKLIYYYWKYR